MTGAGAGGGIGEFEEAADASGALERLAEVESPGVGLPGLFRVGVEDGDLVPAVVDEEVIGGGVFFAVVRDPGGGIWLVPVLVHDPSPKFPPLSP